MPPSHIATQLDNDGTPKSDVYDLKTQDVYFLAQDLAFKTALEANIIKPQCGSSREQICYYDGDPIANAPLNLINVPVGRFTQFFTETSLPLPQRIVGTRDFDIAAQQTLESTFSDMIRQIDASREKTIDKHCGHPPHADTYFLDARVAYHTALQKNRVFVGHPTITGLQVCYYDGPQIEGGPENLIFVPANGLLDFLTNCRTRLPRHIIYPAETAEAEVQAGSVAFAELVEAARTLRYNACLELQRVTKDVDPHHQPSGPLRFFFPCDRRTTVLQYSAKNLAKALERLSHRIFVSMEANDMEELDSLWHLKDYLQFQPHVAVNINHRNNTWLHDNVVNVIWYQDPMPEIKACRPLYWRERDLVYTISSEYADYIARCGAKNVQRQLQCIDDEVFNTDYNIERKNKVVFIGSSYIRQEYKGPNSGALLDEMKNFFARGGQIDMEYCAVIAKKYDVAFECIWPYTANHIIRENVVEWLCSKAPIEVEVYGRDWENNPIVRPYFKGELPHGPELAKVYNSAKYAVSAIIVTINSQRLAELTACGCIPLVYDAREKADKPHWDKECLFFKTQAELYSLMTKEPEGDPKIIGDNFRYGSFAERLLEEIQKITEQADD